ncbi:MAG: DoxX-like family protein [Crocinitomicaceae bacterium]|jgi:hypothetical protein|nr:DoxX-like family protein [Crocinitomicaceae bacterium]
MKATNITYWASSSVVALMMTFSAYMYLTQPMMKANFELMGFNDSFRIELAIAKLIGAVVLLAPAGARLKEWAYAGFTITFISAIVTHISSGHPVQTAVMPAIFLAILGVSWYTNRKRQVSVAL